MILSQLVISREEMLKEKIWGDYSIHRIVYSLFEDQRDVLEKHNGNKGSGFVYVDKNNGKEGHKVIILSNRLPKKLNYGELSLKEIGPDFLMHEDYFFEILINPSYRDHKTKKIVPIYKEDEAKKWFEDKAQANWGFTVVHSDIKSNVLKRFKKANHQVTIHGSYISGKLSVTDQEKFINSFKNGLGRGKAFGFGLLQLVPIK